MANLKKSAKTRSPTGVQPLGQDVAQTSTRTDKPSSQDVVKCMSLMLQCLATDMVSPDVLRMATTGAKHMAKTMDIKDGDKIIDSIMNDVIMPVRRGTLAGTLERSGFW